MAAVVLTFLSRNTTNAPLRVLSYVNLQQLAAEGSSQQPKARHTGHGERSLLITASAPPEAIPLAGCTATLGSSGSRGGGSKSGSPTDKTSEGYRSTEQQALTLEEGVLPLNDMGTWSRGRWRARGAGGGADPW